MSLPPHEGVLFDDVDDEDRRSELDPARREEGIVLSNAIFHPDRRWTA